MLLDQQRALVQTTSGRGAHPGNSRRKNKNRALRIVVNHKNQKDNERSIDINHSLESIIPRKNPPNDPTTSPRNKKISGYFRSKNPEPPTQTLIELQAPQTEERISKSELKRVQNKHFTRFKAILS